MSACAFEIFGIRTSGYFRLLKVFGAIHINLLLTATSEGSRIVGVASITHCKEQLEDTQMLKVVPGKSRILSACFLFLQPAHWSLLPLILFFIISHFSHLTASAQMGGGSPLYNLACYCCCVDGDQQRLLCRLERMQTRNTGMGANSPVINAPCDKHNLVVC